MAKAGKKVTSSQLFNEGVAFSEKGKHDDAIKAFSAAIKLDRKNPKLYLKRGQVYEKKGIVEKAIGDYSAALALDSKDTTALFNRGMQLLKNCAYKDALNDLTKAIELEPKNARFHSCRANIYDRIGMTKDAIDDFTVAIEVEPTNAAHYADRSKLYQCLFMDQECVNDVDMAFEYCSTNEDSEADRSLLAFMYETRGRSLIELVRLQEALVDFSKGIEMEPSNPSLWAGRAMAHNNMRNYQLSIADASQAIKLSPKCIQAYQARSVARRNYGELDESLVDIEIALALATETQQDVDRLLREKDKVIYYLEKRSDAEASALTKRATLMTQIALSNKLRSGKSDRGSKSQHKDGKVMDRELTLSEALQEIANGGVPCRKGVTGTSDGEGSSEVENGAAWPATVSKYVEDRIHAKGRDMFWTDLELEERPFKMVSMCACPGCYSERPRDGGSMMRCGQCKFFIYCSRECQKIHWRCEHRELCPTMPKIKRNSEKSNDASKST